MIFPRQKIYDFDGMKILSNKQTSVDSKNIREKFINQLRIEKTYNLYFTSKGRTALFLIIKYLIKKKGKVEFLLSPFTIFDVVNMIIIAGGKPIFIDFKKDSFDFDEQKLSDNISQKSCALIVCHYSFNQKLDNIKVICKKNDIELIQDCAISLPSKKNNESIFNQSKFSFISFNIFKFLPCIYGGAVVTNDESFHNFFEKETKNWEYYKFNDLIEYFFKAIKFRLFTNTIIFNLFTFWIIKIGEKFNIEIITKSTKNDPNPVLKTNLDFSLKKKLTTGQIHNLKKQLSKVEKFRKVRIKNYKILNLNILNKKLTKIRYETDLEDSSCLNFPIIADDKERFSRYLFKNNIDHSKYFYRNCSNLKIFDEYNTYCKNIDTLEKKLIFFPTHHNISGNQIANLIKIVNNY